MSDHESILAFLDRVKATADAAQTGPWELNKQGDFIAGDRYVLGIKGFEHVEGAASWPIVQANKRHVASSRQTIPQLEQALRVAVEGLQRLASNEAFLSSRATNEEERIRMRHAESTLHTIATICHE